MDNPAMRVLTEKNVEGTGISLTVQSFKKKNGVKYQFNLHRIKGYKAPLRYNSQFFDSVEECTLEGIRTLLKLARDPSQIVNLPRYKPPKRSNYFKNFKGYDDNY